MSAGSQLSLARPRTTVSNDALWLIISIITLVGIAPIAILEATPATRSALLGQVGIVVFAGTRYSTLLWQGHRRPYELIFWLFSYVFMGLAPLVQIATGDFPITTPGITVELNGETAAVAGLGMMAFSIGAFFSRGQQVHTTSTVNERRMMQMTFVSILLSLYFTSKVGVATLFTSRETFDTARSAIWPDPTTRAIVTASGSMPLLVSYISLTRIRKWRNAVGWTAPRVLSYVALGLLLVIVNPISSPRYVFGTVALSIVSALGAMNTRRRFRLLGVWALIVILLIFPYADVARVDTSGSTLAKGGTLEVLTSGDFDAFDQLNNTILYVERNGSTEGRQALGVALFWVPRSIWPSKPLDSGVLIAESRGYSFTNLSEPLWAEFYVNFGWWGVLGGMLGLGWWLRRLDSTVSHQECSVLGTILPFYMIILLRGSLLQAVAYLAILSACTLIIRGPSASEETSSARQAEAEIVCDAHGVKHLGHEFSTTADLASIARRR